MSLGSVSLVAPRAPRQASASASDCWCGWQTVRICTLGAMKLGLAGDELVVKAADLCPELCEVASACGRSQSLRSLVRLRPISALAACS